MPALIRSLLALAAAMIFALPAIGDGTGGGTDGVWILPCSRSISGMPVGGITQMSGPRATRSLMDFSRGLTMQMPPEMGGPIAVLNEMPSYTRLPMQVSGNCVVIPMSTLKAVHESTLGRADGWMTDGNGRGFLLRVSRGNGGSIVVEIY